jgi:hypothetical protein
MVDDVPIGELEQLLEHIENVVSMYEDKRINVNIVEQKLVQRP